MTSKRAASGRPGVQGRLAGSTFNSFFLYRVSMVAAVGGLLFGFDLAVMAGAIPFLVRKFSLTPGELGMAVSSVALGCMVGTMIAGSLSDWLGRKKLLLVAAVVFFCSSLFAGMPNSVSMLVWARIFSGVAIGISSPISPVYISELAPPHIRGKLVTLNQLAITIGFLVAYLVDWLLASLGTPEWRDEYAWRWMFMAGAVPSLVFLFLLLSVPESPRYLLRTGQVDKARDVLTRVAGDEYAAGEIDQINRTLSVASGSISQLFRRPFLRPMVIGIVLMVFSQVAGLKAITNYSPKLLLELGFQTESSAMRGMVAVGVVLTFSTILAMMFVDKLGRKVLLSLSSAGMVVSLTLLAVEFRYDVFPNWVTLLIVLFATVSYASGIGPCSWLIISEIFPTRVRGAASSIATFTLWAADFVVLLAFPVMQHWSQVGTFVIFACISAFFGVLLAFITPETKGKSLEQIESYWLSKADKRHPQA